MDYGILSQFFSKGVLRVLKIWPVEVFAIKYSIVSNNAKWQERTCVLCLYQSFTWRRNLSLYHPCPRPVGRHPSATRFFIKASSLG